MSTSNKKGFTLIEMAVVLLIIGILAGIVLRNIGSFSPQARDTRRIADLNIVSTYLAQYSANKGYFPIATTWTALEAKLKDVGIANIPAKDPSGDDYTYWYCTTSGATNPNHFVLRAKLEQSPTANPRIYDNSYDSNSPPSDWACSTSTFDCSKNSNFYCLIQ